MRRDRSARQPDLFVTADPALSCEPPPPDFIARIRDELTRTLARARDAAVLPWRDLTQAYLAELRFNSIAGWLPNDEADPLRADFRRELDRLYAAVESSDEA
jgi:hypothetical protein